VRALLQRVSRAEVRIEGDLVSSIERGLLVLLGVAPGDDEFVAAGLAAKGRRAGRGLSRYGMG